MESRLMAIKAMTGTHGEISRERRVFCEFMGWKKFSSAGHYIFAAARHKV
jgi:hypothetical protein